MMKKRLAMMILALCMVMAAGCGQKGGTQPAGNGTPDHSASDEGGAGSTDRDAENADGNGAEMGSPNPGTEGDMPETDGSAQGGENGADGAGEDSEAVVMTLRIVDGAETGSLVLAGGGAGEVYTLNVGDADVYVDGMLSSASVLEDGMLAEIRYTGGINDSFPAQLGSAESISVYSKGSPQNPLGAYYDLCGLYLQVLNDLWDVDSGLNDGASYVSVDLSDAPGDLTEGEKDAVAWIFACAHNAEPLMLTYNELAEQGYLSEYGESADDGPKAYAWGDGVLFSITAKESEGTEVYSLPVLRFDAEKWRSPLGAYLFVDCKAVWSESGSWGSYSIGAEAIS